MAGKQTLIYKTLGKTDTCTIISNHKVVYLKKTIILINIYKEPSQMYNLLTREIIECQER